MSAKYTIALMVTVISQAVLLGCKRYPDQAQLASPAYLRVYNDIPFVLDAFHSDQTQPFFTFIMDPTYDKDSVPTGGAVVGDFLTTRELFSTSYPINTGNSSKAGDSSYPKNYDYPGNLHVLTAPSINGLDLSAWAQIRSGTHHILFMSRPFSDTPFAKLPMIARQRKVIDTTLTFQQDEVYTLEAVTADQKASKYGAYLRKEDFTHQTFFKDKIYASIFNLSGNYDRTVSGIATSPTSDYLSDTLNIFYTYYYYDKQATQLVAFNGYNNIFYEILEQHFQTISPYLTLPLVSNSYFLDDQGVLAKYADDAAGGAVLPFISFNLVGPRGSTVHAASDPSTLNQSDNGAHITVGPPAANSVYPLVNFNYISSVGTGLTVEGTINILELVYDRIYQIQIVRKG